MGERMIGMTDKLMPNPKEDDKASEKDEKDTKKEKKDDRDEKKLQKKVIIGFLLHLGATNSLGPQVFAVAQRDE